MINMSLCFGGSILEYVDMYLHSQNVLFISVQIIVVNFIRLVQINFKENLQNSYFKTGHYGAGVEKKVPNVQRCKITRLFEFCIGPCPRRSTAVRPLRLWVRILPGGWMVVCCVLSSRGLCDKLITRPEKSYRLWRVVVCDQKTRE